MTNEEFLYWLAGYFQLEDASVILTPNQFTIIQNHLNLVKEVDGHFSKENMWLFGELMAIQKKPSVTAAERESLTQQMRQLYLKCIPVK